MSTTANTRRPSRIPHTTFPVRVLADRRRSRDRQQRTSCTNEEDPLRTVAIRNADKRRPQCRSPQPQRRTALGSTHNFMPTKPRWLLPSWLCACAQRRPLKHEVLYRGRRLATLCLALRPMQVHFAYLQFSKQATCNGNVHADAYPVSFLLPPHPAPALSDSYLCTAKALRDTQHVNTAQTDPQSRMQSMEPPISHYVSGRHDCFSSKIGSTLQLEHVRLALATSENPLAVPNTRAPFP